MRTHLTVVMTAQVVSVALVAALVCLWALAAAAEWPHGPMENLPICTVEHIQSEVGICADGEGGTIIVWSDVRVIGNEDIYAQRVTALGDTLWPADGVKVSLNYDTDDYPAVVSDGAGGAIIAWRELDGGDHDIYAQRISADGLLLWAVGGVAVCTAPTSQQSMRMISDGAGGAILAWHDSQNGNYDVFTQRIDGDGSVLWASGGVALCVDASGQFDIEIVSDSAGGAIIAWHDGRNASYDIYVNRISEGGVVFWATNGNAVCSATGEQGYHQMVSDGVGGAIITWRDDRLGDYDLYAQRVDYGGNMLWVSDGVGVCSDINSQTNPRIITTGGGGSIVVFQNYTGSNYDIYAQRLDGVGNVLWASGGLPICAETGWQGEPEIISDGQGGALIAWRDNRTGSYYENDIRIQRINDSGSKLWLSDGIPVSLALNWQYNQCMVSDGVGGALIAWQDNRNGSDDIYAQRVERNGLLGYPAPSITGATDHPDDQGGVVVLGWLPSYLDEWPLSTVDTYSVWRRYGGIGARRMNAEAFPGSQAPVTIEDFGRYGWVYVDEVDAMQFEAYGYHAPSYGDSVAAGIIYTDFMVLAESSSLGEYWASGVVTAYSLDNLAPGAPLTLLAEAPSIDVELTWSPSGYHDEDLSVYNVYRGAVSGFTPDETTLIGTAADTLYTDAASGASTWYYRVSAVDVHDNEGDPSNEASVSTTGVADDPFIPGAFALRGNFPNPFNPTTRITFDLPDAAEVRLDIYSASGRRMATLVEGVMVPGRHDVLWRGLGAGGRTVPSGVYFARLEAGGETANHKMILLK